MQALEAMQASSDGIMVLVAIHDRRGQVTDFRVVAANKAAAILLQRTERELTDNFSIRSNIKTDIAEKLVDRYSKVFQSGQPLSEELRADRSVSAARWLMHQAVKVPAGVAVTIRDITAHKRELRRLERASLTDELTGLSNRRGFMVLADQQLSIARRNSRDILVMYADMNRFKQINDRHGHAMGDDVLKAVGRLLRRTVRECDVVARLGGDEFAMIATDADGRGGKAIKHRVERCIAQLNASGVFPEELSLSIGFTRVAPSDTASVAELLNRADQLLYRKKRQRDHSPKATQAARKIRLSPGDLMQSGRRRQEVFQP